MPTESYIIAQKVIQKIKPECPYIFIASGKNGFTFFPGSDFEQTVQFRRMIGRSTKYWDTFVSERHEDHEIRPWGTKINGYWMVKTYNKILRDAVCQEMGITKEEEESAAYCYWDHTHEVVGRAIQISKRKLWGIPLDPHAENLHFHRILLTCAKKTIPETTWKLACKNVGNVYGINESVILDAIVQERAYRSLYGIHPLLGLLWTPMPRSFVERQIDERADALHYAGQVISAMRSVGVQKSSMKTLHRIAEKEPMTARMVICRLVQYGHGPTTKDETVALLNLLNGRSPPYGGGTSFRNVVVQTFRYAGEEDRNPVLRNPHDLLVVASLQQWLRAGDRDGEREGVLILDWAESRAKERPGSLHRGFESVLKNCEAKGIRSLARKKAAVLAWADRAQRQWHRNIVNRRFETPCAESHLQWEPILKNQDMEFSDGKWSFVELSTSESLREEGRLMEHCVGMYDFKCASGKSHIFSVRNADGERISTLEIGVGLTKRSGRKFFILQNLGFRNRQPPISCRRAAKAFLNHVNGIRDQKNNGMGGNLELGVHIDKIATNK